MKTLIVYGTRYGATGGTAAEIAKILGEADFEVKVVDLKKEKVKDIFEFELIVVGNGMKLGKWTNEAEDFLKKFQNQLGQKKLALFASTMKPVFEREGKTEAVEDTRKAALDDKVKKYNLQPIALGFFGGVLNFNEMGFFFRKTFGAIKPQLEADGFKASEPDVYDLRDWEEIRSWAKDIAQKASQ